MAELQGLVFIGDPHLASRVPGFRKDDYPSTILGKLRWALAYARDCKLLPVLLGDLFHWPRDNSNRLLVELISMFDGNVYAIAGNHDSVEDRLTDDDSLSILASSGRLRLLTPDAPWRGVVQGVDVVLGGTPWGMRLPERFDKPPSSRPQLVIWVTHHDLSFGGYEAARLDPREIPGVDVVINGHIHRPLPSQKHGSTTWVNPGSIARVNRSDASKARRPAVLRIDIAPTGIWSQEEIQVPHLPFDEVFHPEMDPGRAPQDTRSMFVRGLAELEALKTSSGAGLVAFLDRNLDPFDPDVAEEIRRLAREVLADGE